MEDPENYHYTVEVNGIPVRLARAVGIQHIPERKMVIASYNVNGKHRMQSVTEDNLTDEEIEERVLEKVRGDMLSSENQTDLPDTP